MVDWAMELLAQTENLIAIAETKWSLPDAIQLFTPCTIGNGRLIVLNWGKMGLSLFSQRQHAGFRIWLDLVKTRRVPNIYNWHMRLTPPHAISKNQLVQIYSPRVAPSYPGVRFPLHGSLTYLIHPPWPSVLNVTRPILRTRETCVCHAKAIPIMKLLKMTRHFIDPPHLTPPHP